MLNRHGAMDTGKNKLDGRTLASIAVAGRGIFLRTDTHLYRIEQMKH